MFKKLTWRQNDLIAGCCHDGINVGLYAGMVATAPKDQWEKNAGGSRHEPTQMDQFHGSYLATVRDAKSTTPGIFRAKTNWTRIEFVPEA